jgi:hypothetical protein
LGHVAFLAELIGDEVEREELRRKLLIEPA